MITTTADLEQAITALVDGAKAHALIWEHLTEDDQAILLAVPEYFRGNAAALGQLLDVVRQQQQQQQQRRRQG
jgi:hypothetical protein